MIYGIVVAFVPIYRPVRRPVVLICPKCQARIPVSSKFCPECGADLRPKCFSKSTLSNLKENNGSL